MKKVFSKPAMAFIVAAAMLMGSACAQALEAGDPPITAPAKARKKAAKNHAPKGARAKFIQGSEETVAQRTARLKRECKGGVNAGACAGYTR